MLTFLVSSSPKSATVNRIDVLEVLVVDLPDLQLLQQDVGERDAPGVELEASVVVDLVAVVELVEEHVDHGHGATEVDLARLAGHGERLHVALVAERFMTLTMFLRPLPYTA